jgi:CspA family cold shock protein
VHGTVKSYNRDRGFGFIKRDSNDPDVFVHISELQVNKLYTLQTGQRVSFAMTEHEKGPRASDVRLA